MTPEQELLALASQLARPVSQDPRTTTPEEREVSLLIDALAARRDTLARASAWLQERLAREAAERHERETDPLTTLRAPLLPNAPDDVVIVGSGPGVPFFEFRREDGRRYVYATTSPVCCIPRADWERENWGADWTDSKQQLIRLRAALVCKAEHFDDLPRMVAEAYSNQAFPPDFRANRLEGIASSLVQTDDLTRSSQLVRWYKHSSVAQVGEHFTIADLVRSRFASWGELHRIVDEVAEINKSSSGLGPTAVIYR